MHLLDHLAQGRKREAMDVAAQELKAIEKALQDESWQEAQYLRLLDDRLFTMLDDEDHALVAAEARDREKIQPWRTWRGKDKGGWKGKEKGASQPRHEWPAAQGAPAGGDGKGKPGPWADRQFEDRKGVSKGKEAWKGGGKRW